MKTCIKEGCENMTEGKLDFCASHARQARNISKQRQKESEKRERQKQISLQTSADTRAVYRQAKIKKLSKRRAAESITYGLLRDNFLKQNPYCQIKANEYCSKLATTVHHMAGRIGALFLDVSKWKGACMSCHQYVEMHPKEAKEKGWSMSRLATTEPHKI